VSAGSPVNSAETTQVRRIARLMPPLCNMGLPLLHLLHNSIVFSHQLPAKTSVSNRVYFTFDDNRE